MVEDDQRLSETVSLGLEEEGHVVTSCASAEEATDLLDMDTYDAIILDWRLPGRSGPDLLKQLRASGDATPVLLLTALDDVHFRVQGLDAGADDYLAKPFSLLELFARLRAITRRAAAMPGTSRFADLSLDPVTREVRRGRRTLEVTQREFLLLELFMRHPGRVLTRGVIADHLWGLDFDIGSNVIDVHVRRLRNKLEADGETRLIHTRRGVGYQMKEMGEPGGTA